MRNQTSTHTTTNYQKTALVKKLLGTNPCKSSELVVKYLLTSDQLHLIVQLRRTVVLRKGNSELSRVTTRTVVYSRENHTHPWGFTMAATSPTAEQQTLDFWAKLPRERQTRAYWERLGRPYDRAGYRTPINAHR